LDQEQDQYESLASAGIRAVEVYGCKIQECKFRLESNSDAFKHPGKRIRLAKEYGLSLGQVAAAIDASYRVNEGGRTKSLEQILEEMKEPQCIAA
jgi:coenzyme F420-reducing hydrogenase delta subunit